MKLHITSVGCTTLIGADRSKYPVKRGNCFDVYCDDGKNYKVANMYWENLDCLLKKGIISYPIEADKFLERGLVISDSRVPKEYLNDKWCTVCFCRDDIPEEHRPEEKLGKSGNTIIIGTWKVE